MSETEVTLAEDKWATLKRVLPRDVYDLVLESEHTVAMELEIGTEALGSSVMVWTVLGHFLLENRVALKEKAREWNGE